MFINLVKIKLKEDTLEEFKRLALPLVAASQQESGCLEYNLYHDDEDPLTVCFVEKWQDQESLDLHKTLPHFTSVITQLMSLCAKPAEKNKLFVID